METVFNEAVGAVVPDPTPSTDPDGFERVVGTSARLTQVVSKARVLAGVNAAVLLHGETGVGKEVFARALHEHGSHPRAPFVALNCGGLSRELLASELFGYVDGAFTGARRAGMIGKVEAANGGTLFLDEIAELPLDLQPFLLRVLEGGEVYPLGSNKPRRVRFRLIAACNRELPVEIKAGRFRMDLFYRISVTSLHIPPLRERKEDLPALVEHFAEGVAERHGTRPKRFSNEVLEAFASYSWPGNLRELRNVVEAMMLLSDDDTVGLSALPLDLLAPVPAPLNVPMPETANANANAHAPLRGLREAEREAIETAIGAHAGNITLVARGLGISRSTLYLKLKKYGLEHSLNNARSSLS
jgi:transcriptional regulator with PAS, ATPase and Fis domain